MERTAQGVKRARAVFFGTPSFAVPCLEALTEVADVAHVITQPDRPQGRKLAKAAPAVKQRAEELGLPVSQPTKIRTSAFANWLRSLEADVGVVVAYGRILPASVLGAPRLGCVNVHASLLPKYRGAAPVQWAVLNGERETGVTLMQMDEGMDTGPILAQRRLEIGAGETSGELAPRLSQLGAELLRRELPVFLRGALEPQPQEDGQATEAPLLRKEHGAIDWARPAPRVADHVRGMHPWPGAFTRLGDKRVKVHRVRVGGQPASQRGPQEPPGTVIRADRQGIEVACEPGSIVIEELQQEGRRRMTAEQALAGRWVQTGDRFSAGSTA